MRWRDPGKCVRHVLLAGDVSPNQRYSSYRHPLRHGSTELTNRVQGPMAPKTSFQKHKLSFKFFTNYNIKKAARNEATFFVYIKRIKSVGQGNFFAVACKTRVANDYL